MLSCTQPLNTYALTIWTYPHALWWIVVLAIFYNCIFSWEVKYENEIVGICDLDPTHLPERSVTWTKVSLKDAKMCATPKTSSPSATCGPSCTFSSSTFLPFLLAMLQKEPVTFFTLWDGHVVTYYSSLIPPIHKIRTKIHTWGPSLGLDSTPKFTQFDIAHTHKKT